MTDAFWLNNPAILLNNKHITEIWPYKDLDYVGKLNAVTRLVLLLTIIGFFTSGFFKILVSAAITLVMIAMMYKSKGRVKDDIRNKIVKEGFINPIKTEVKTLPFTKPTPKNPFMNVLLPEIKYNPERQAAAPSFNPKVEKEINTSAGNVGPDPRLFLDLGDTLSFEQSMQRFYTTANSRVENDQNAFAQFCYGNMPSCKEGDGLQCIKNNPRWIN
jgi:hypothetical protein|tara:strand:- start:264 stop:911 length:648 start_codon:yes stop_codon:yes gene_type:complete